MGFIAGLDLGQAHDYSALVIVERQQPPREELVRGSKPPPAQYAVRFIKRWELGTPYPVMVRELEDLLTQWPLVDNTKLLVDYTGVGRPLVDLLKQASLRPVAVSIHGGDRVSQDGMDYRVPKRDLVGVVAVLLQQQRLQIAESLPQTPILTQELLNFKVRIDPNTSHDSYSAWREKDHDDLVLALALAVWWGEFRGERRAGVWAIRW
jgi:hypothetical protein